MKFKIPHIPNMPVCITTVMILATMAIMSVAYASAEPKKQSGQNNKGKQEFTVVIDAGHGGHDHGAVDNGAREKEINLGVAKKFAELVKKKLKNVKVVMTRDDDTFISLQERANIANRNKGNLFISIHTNSVDKSNPNRKTVSGTSVYALGPQKDANNLKVAQRENSVIELEDNYHQKYSGFDPSKDESYIIFEMAQKKNLGQSLRFADKAQKELVATASRKDRGVKQAGFWVLWATSMPSVLVELDFICNPTQADYMKSESGQKKLAEALCNALKSYVETYRNTAAPAGKNAGLHTDPAYDNKETSLTIAQPQESPSAINTLASASQKEGTRKRQHITPSKTKTAARPTARKRRSDSSRKLSDDRIYETGPITLKSETALLATRESAASTEMSDTDISKKPESPKESGVPDSKKKDKKEQKDSRKKDGNKSRSGKKTYVVKNGNATGVVTADNKTGRQTITGKTSEHKNMDAKGAERASRKIQARITESPRTIYTIQLIASDKEIADNDPSFCGLVPSGMFVENGKYKYTYGRSENRREIEQKLLQVKSIIPEASIVVRSE